MYNEKEDLFKLIHSLSKIELKEFKIYSKGLNSKINTLAMQLFKYIKKQSTYNESNLIAKLKISKQQFRDSKFHLFNIIVGSLKRGGDPNLVLVCQRGCLRSAFATHKKKLLQRSNEASKIAPIEEEILFVEQSGTKRLERKAGSPFLKCLTVSLLKNLNSKNDISWRHVIFSLVKG